MTPLRIFIGWDHRQPVSFAVLAHSIIKHASRPVQITPLVIDTLPIKSVGLTPFTFSRFLVPWLCDYRGHALFLDVDMLVRADIAELFDLADDSAVMVSKNEKKFEWASAILFDCAQNTMLTPEVIEMQTMPLHKIGWLKEEQVGEFPSEWNHLVGYDSPRDDAKLVHFTQGVPYFPETQDTEYAEEWNQALASSVDAAPWFALMGKSIHAAPVHERLSAAFPIGGPNGKL